MLPLCGVKEALLESLEVTASVLDIAGAAGAPTGTTFDPTSLAEGGTSRGLPSSNSDRVPPIGGEKKPG